MNKKYYKKNSGYAVLEILLYILLFAVLSIAVINSIIVMTRSFKEVQINRDLIEGATLMERISREIRHTESIVSIDNTNIKVNSKDENNISQTITFALSGGNILYSKNDIFVDNLNSSDVVVSDLIFTSIGSPSVNAIKIHFGVSSLNDSFNRVEDFYNTVVFRGMY